LGNASFKEKLAMKPIVTITLASAVLALTACNRADGDRAAQAPAAAAQTPVAASPPRFDGAPADPNAFGARTDPRLAFHDAPQSKLPPGKGGSPEAQEAKVEANWAVAKAPDTASADAAKREVLEQHAREQGTDNTHAPTARDTPANNPRHGALTKGEESSSMPKAGQVNNHSSTALEADSGNPGTH
jgi:hypothetical protein